LDSLSLGFPVHADRVNDWFNRNESSVAFLKAKKSVTAKIYSYDICHNAAPFVSAGLRKSPEIVICSVVITDDPFILISVADWPLPFTATGKA
tara:strand:- start:9794 stop:10072 length:279 start_codon:yes stop_codon:yes gene_type:complete